MIWLLLNIAYTASIPSVPCSYSSVNRLGVVKSLGGDTAETTDPGWPKGYLIPCNIMFNDKMKSFSKVAVAQGLAGHLHVGGNFFCINFFLHLLNCLNDNPWVCSLFPFSPPSCWGWEQKTGSILSSSWPLPTIFPQLHCHLRGTSVANSCHYFLLYFC